MGQCVVGETLACELAGYPEADTSGHDECYVGMDDRAHHGQLDCLGCGIACIHCVDEPGNMQKWADSTRGTRFIRVRPLPDVGRRDAEHKLHDLRSRQPRLVFSPMWYQRAMVYDQDDVQAEVAVECFGYHVCEAWPVPNYITSPGQSYCPGGAPLGGLVGGHTPDAFFYVDEGGFPLQDCARFDEGFSEPDQNILVDSDYGNTVLLRAAHSHDLDEDERITCITDALVVCTGPVDQSPECPDCTVFDRVNTPWYNSHSSRQDFNYAGIDLSTARFRMPGSPSEQLEAEIDLKNAVLTFVEGYTFPGGPLGTKFDRLDYQVVGDPDKVGLWERSFDGMSMALAELPKVCDLAESRTRFGDLEVDAELVIVAVDITMHLIAHRTMWNSDADRNDYVTPRAVFTIEVTCGIRASIEAGHEINGEEVVVTHPAENDRFPTVNPSGNAILYAITAGLWIKPPHKVTWRGWLNDFSDPVTARIALTEAQVMGTLPTYAVAIREALDGTYIPARATRLTSNPSDPNRTYEGGVTIGF